MAIFQRKGVTVAADQRRGDAQGPGHIVNPHPLLTAADVMTTSVISLGTDTTVDRAIRTFLREGITGAPVIDGQNRLLGMLGETACMRLLATSTFEDLPDATWCVGDQMVPREDVLTVSEEDDLHQVAGLFLHKGARRVPVVDADDRVVGIITRSNVMRGLEKILDAPSRPAARYPDYSKPDPDMTG